jgi:hypothetical protein
MMTHSTIPHQLPVSNANDLITLRQAIRQAARGAGMGAANQARITAATSEVARALIGETHSTSAFTIRTSELQGGPKALEVVCETTLPQHIPSPAALSRSPALVGSAALIDHLAIEAAADSRVIIVMKLAC